MCSQSSSRDFKLANYQRFLRRVLSPDSPVRGLLMVHGTGTGKTCTAIQIAEEYIIRPEFQEKRVLVLANPAVQENFKTQIFDMERVTVDPDGLLLSKQCTGRRYLDMLLRIQSEPLKWSDKASRERINTIGQRIISEFYEFQGYNEFANKLNNQQELGGQTHVEAWIHKTFDNRMIIVDEAHNMVGNDQGKALKKIIENSRNLKVILLTATPMKNFADEIVDSFHGDYIVQHPKEIIEFSLGEKNNITQASIIRFLEVYGTRFDFVSLLAWFRRNSSIFVDASHWMKHLKKFDRIN
jgi:type I site-specific restriction endonuclease